MIVPNITTGVFIVMALVWAWLSDGLFRGARWPFIYIGAVITVSSKPFKSMSTL
jgi:MFS transporter, ACS family, pantothenate transporter